MANSSIITDAADVAAQRRQPDIPETRFTSLAYNLAIIFLGSA